jgi:hypothetical protein
LQDAAKIGKGCKDIMIGFVWEVRYAFGRKCSGNKIDVRNIERLFPCIDRHVR